MPGILRAFSLFVALLMAGTTTFASQASAHPHVWIDGFLTLHVDEQKRLTSITSAWVFDEAYTAYTIEERDKNHNKKYEPAELQDLIDGAMDRLEEWHYFTDLRQPSGQRVAFLHATDAVASVKDNKLIFTFTLPLASPLPADGLTVRIYDPSFYMDLAPAEKDPVHFDSAGCHYQIKQAQPLQETMLMSEGAFQNQDITPDGADGSIGAAYASRILLECP